MKLHTKRGTAYYVDAEDYDLIKEFNWTVQSKGKGRLSYLSTRSPSGKNILLHRLLLSPPSNKVIHHKDGNGLNNQKNNLDCLTPHEHRSEHARIRMEKVEKECGFKEEKKTSGFNSFSFRIDPVLENRINKECQKERRTIANYLSLVLKKHFEELDGKELNCKVVPNRIHAKNFKEYDI